jgi:hypothetical protein
MRTRKAILFRRKRKIWNGRRRRGRRERMRREEKDGRRGKRKLVKARTENRAWSADINERLG